MNFTYAKTDIVCDPSGKIVSVHVETQDENANDEHLYRTSVYVGSQEKFVCANIHGRWVNMPYPTLKTQEYHEDEILRALGS